MVEWQEGDVRASAEDGWRMRQSTRAGGWSNRDITGAVTDLLAIVAILTHGGLPESTAVDRLIARRHNCTLLDSTCVDSVDRRNARSSAHLIGAALGLSTLCSKRRHAELALQAVDCVHLSSHPQAADRSRRACFECLNNYR